MNMYGKIHNMMIRCPHCGGRIVVISGPNGKWEVCTICRACKKIGELK
jgi:ssDNA-binding Zn-finger/Zn-ribbon topoisomerase 1